MPAFALDLTRQKSGGGLQIAHRTLDALTDIRPARNGWGSIFCIARDESELAGHATEQLGADRVLLAPETLSRHSMRFFLRELPAFVQDRDIGAIYTLFGPPPLIRSSAVRLCGCAYGNILAGDDKFWPRRPRSQYIRRRAVDSLRRQAMRRADWILVETTHLAETAPDALDFPRNRIAVLPPPAPPWTRAQDVGYVIDESKRDELSTFDVLFLTSNNHNKGLDRLPETLRAIDAIAPESRLRVSVSLNAADLPSQLRDLLTSEVGWRLNLIGQVSREALAFTWTQHHAGLCLSRLESFTNVVLEAFTFERPLVISDSDWARAAALDAAIYVDRDDPLSIAGGLLKIERSPRAARALTERGKNHLRNYPDAGSRLERVMDLARLTVERQCGIS